MDFVPGSQIIDRIRELRMDLENVRLMPTLIRLPALYVQELVHDKDIMFCDGDKLFGLEVRVWGEDRIQVETDERFGRFVSCKTPLGPRGPHILDPCPMSPAA